MKVTPIATVLGTLLAALPVHAQWGWGPSYHASTAGESYQRGFADVVRSAGAANLMNSAAMKNVEDARAKYINNRLNATKTYFEMKRYNKDYRDANKKPRPTSEQLFRLAKSKTPGTLSPADLDPVTGAVNWPEVLQTEAYDEAREKLDALFADRAKAGNADYELCQKISENVQQMQDDLKGQINDIAPQVFSSANAFLKKLEYSAGVAG